VDERFIPLATFIRGRSNASAPVAPQASAVAIEREAAAPGVARGIVDFAHADVVHELALMRLAAIEAYERATATLLRALADDVLVRELALAPADLEALVKRALSTFGDCEPLALRVSPADAGRVQAGLPVRVDPTLDAGDLVVDVRDGAYESQFALRLEDALARAAGRQ